jgi:L-gulonolactone oxidase
LASSVATVASEPVHWTNWTGDQRCRPAEVVRPASSREVADAVSAAVAAGRGVRVAGAGHSFSDAVLTGGTLLSLERMDALLDVDAGARLVRVQAGIPLHRLSAGLAAHGLALPNLGDVDRQHLGGALATATHGTGVRRRNISAQVVAAQVVTGAGDVREIDEDDGDLLPAVRVSTGALGAVTELTLRCVPAFRLHAVDRREPLGEVLAELDERVDAADHFELYTFPHSPWALTRTNSHTDAPAKGPPEWKRKIEQIWLDNRLFGLVCRIGALAPRLIPRLNRFAGRAMGGHELVAESHAVFASPRLVRFTEMEYAIPREHAVEALHAVKEVLERHPVSFPVELRFLGGDDALLSTAYGRDTAYIAAHVYRGLPYEAPLREVEALMARFDGRPHWGKRSWLTAGELAPRYPRWADFQAARAELDPAGTFTNGYAGRMLGPAVTESSAPRHGTSAPRR